MKIIGLSERYTNLGNASLALRLSAPISQEFFAAFVAEAKTMGIPFGRGFTIEHCEDDKGILLVPNMGYDEMFVHNLNAALTGATARLKETRNQAKRSRQSAPTSIAKHLGIRMVDDIDELPQSVLFNRQQIVELRTSSPIEIEITVASGKCYKLKGEIEALKVFCQALDSTTGSPFVSIDGLELSEKK